MSWHLEFYKVSGNSSCKCAAKNKKTARVKSRPAVKNTGVENHRRW